MSALIRKYFFQSLIYLGFAVISLISTLALAYGPEGSDISFHGSLKSGEPCSLEVNTQDGSVFFDSPRLRCGFVMNEKNRERFITDLVNPGPLVIKGVSTYVKCRARLNFDQNGNIKAVKFGTKLLLESHYKNVRCESLNLKKS